MLHTCGVHNRNTTNRYVEILCFQDFVRFMTFKEDGEESKNKLLKDKIEVSVVLDLDLEVGWVDMSQQFYVQAVFFGDVESYLTFLFYHLVLSKTKV
jgi:hypothetical protein